MDIVAVLDFSINFFLFSWLNCWQALRLSLLISLALQIGPYTMPATPSTQRPVPKSTSLSSICIYETPPAISPAPTARPPIIGSQYLGFLNDIFFFSALSSASIALCVSGVRPNGVTTLSLSSMKKTSSCCSHFTNVRSELSKTGGGVSFFSELFCSWNSIVSRS